MYLALRPPWGRGVASAPIDAGVALVAPGDAGAPTKPKKRPRRPGGAAGAPGVPGAPAGPDEVEELEPPPPPLTEADRRLEWRGDDVALPPTKIDMASGGEARPLDDGEINATVGSQSGGVRDCVVAGATGTDLQ